jgi:MOSC domain-containing protein YiiM
MPRKERQSTGVMLVAPTQPAEKDGDDGDDDDKEVTDDNNSHGGLVALPAADPAAQALKTKEHEDKMMKLEETRRQNAATLQKSTSSVAPTPARAKTSASPFSSPAGLKQRLFALGKRLISSPFSSKRSRKDDAADDENGEPSSKRRRVGTETTKQVYPITRTAKFEEASSDDVEGKVSTPTSAEESNGDAEPAATAAAATNGTVNGVAGNGDYNHYRLSGGAERDKDQHPTTRAVSLAAMSVYDEIESFLASTEKDNDSTAPIVYGDLGENFLIAGIPSLADTTSGGSNPAQLRVGMRLRFGGAAILSAPCPTCGAVAKKTDAAPSDNLDDNATSEEKPMTTEGAEESTSITSPATAVDAAIIEICHINNPCSRLENVPWSQRALTAVGGSMWGHHPTLKKYGWWWSPRMPLNDLVHPGGRGVLCRVVQGGIVREGDAVTLLATTSS